MFLSGPVGQNGAIEEESDCVRSQRWTNGCGTLPTSPQALRASGVSGLWTCGQRTGRLKRLRHHLKPTNNSRRIDETYIRVKGAWCYPYRAIDSTGATIDFLLSALRDAAAAKRLFGMALSNPSHSQPRVISADKACPYGAAIAAVKAEGTLRSLPPSTGPIFKRHLEQDHRAIKRRVKAKQRIREFRAAGRTIAGYEAIHMIRKRQARWVSDDDVRQQNRLIDQLFDLAP